MVHIIRIAHIYSAYTVCLAALYMDKLVYALKHLCEIDTATIIFILEMNLSRYHLTEITQLTSVRVRM